jgi:hypothetical protein
MIPKVGINLWHFSAQRVAAAVQQTAQTITPSFRSALQLQTQQATSNVGVNAANAGMGAGGATSNAASAKFNAGGRFYNAYQVRHASLFMLSNANDLISYSTLRKTLRSLLISKTRTMRTTSDQDRCEPLANQVLPVPLKSSTIIITRPPIARSSSATLHSRALIRSQAPLPRPLSSRRRLRLV